MVGLETETGKAAKFHNANFQLNWKIWKKIVIFSLKMLTDYYCS